MLSMGIEHYGQPHGVFFVLEVSNAFFTTVFGLGRQNVEGKHTELASSVNSRHDVTITIYTSSLHCPDLPCPR